MRETLATKSPNECHGSYFLESLKILQQLKLILSKLGSEAILSDYHGVPGGFLLRWEMVRVLESIIQRLGMQVSRWIEFKNIFPIIHELWSHSNLQRRHLKWLNASPTSVLFAQLKLQMSTRMTKHSSPGGVWFYTWIWRLSAGG